MDQKITYKIGNHETEEINHENRSTSPGCEATFLGVRVGT